MANSPVVRSLLWAAGIGSVVSSLWRTSSFSLFFISGAFLKNKNHHPSYQTSSHVTSAFKSKHAGEDNFFLVVHYENAQYSLGGELLMTLTTVLQTLQTTSIYQLSISRISGKNYSEIRYCREFRTQKISSLSPLYLYFS